jgi:FSR family fosmidomycin resistance protein-like MFS transporter
MTITLIGLVLLAFASGYPAILAAAALIGLGSAIFHPESSRMARLASGGRHGFAQSLFQVGGNAGTAMGPLLAAWIVVPRGQRYVLVFTPVAFCGIFVLSRVGSWYGVLVRSRLAHPHHPGSKARLFNRSTVAASMFVLLVLMFSKFFYQAAMTNYYTFFLMQKFSLSVQSAQYCLFLLLFAVASGTMVGGLLGDRFGRKSVIWISILGSAPFCLLLPHANLFWTTGLSVVIGFTLAWAFPAILVYATELMPDKVGLVAGMFFGLAFGLAGIGSAALGKLADATSVQFVMSATAFLPLLGLAAGLLPNLEPKR